MRGGYLDRLGEGTMIPGEKLGVLCMPIAPKTELGSKFTSQKYHDNAYIACILYFDH